MLENVIKIRNWLFLVRKYKGWLTVWYTLVELYFMRERLCGSAWVLSSRKIQVRR